MIGNPYFIAYCTHVCGAASRKIEFLLTFEEWLQIWLDSGRIDERGTRKGKYVMARFGDIGPYAVGNVKIILHTENIREAHAGKIVTKLARRNMSEAHKGQKGHVHTKEQRVKMTVANNIKWGPGGCFWNGIHSKKMAATKKAKTPEEKAMIGSKGWETRRRNKSNG